MRASVDLEPLDLGATFAMQRFGLYDPTASVAPRRIAKALSTESGPCVVAMERTASGVALTVEGGDERAVMTDLESALSADDGRDAFSPAHPVLARLHRKNPGLRLVRVPWRFDVACSVVLQQRVTVREAWQQWRRIAARYGERAPSRFGELRAFPSVERVARMESWRFEELGVDPKRTRALIGLARDALRRGTFAWTDVPRVRKHLRAVRGIGPWTTEMTLGYGWGDPDALPLADLHLPHVVAWALAREPRGSDERMQELLEPTRPHRFRAVRLILTAAR